MLESDPLQGLDVLELRAIEHQALLQDRDFSVQKNLTFQTEHAGRDFVLESEALSLHSDDVYGDFARLLGWVMAMTAWLGRFVRL